MSSPPVFVIEEAIKIYYVRLLCLMWLNCLLVWSHIGQYTEIVPFLIGGRT